LLGAPFLRRPREILAQKLEGGEPRLLGRLEGTWIAPYSVSADGRWLLGALYDPESQSDIWSLDLQASDPGVATRVLVDPGEEVAPALSPDGRWLAFTSWGDGIPDIYLERFPGGESRVRVSSSGGDMARWSPDGRELFYLDPEGTAVLAVAVRTEPKLELGAPRRLFPGAFWTDTGTGPVFVVTNDGKRYALLRRHEDPKRSAELIVVQNWFADVSKLFGAGSR